MNKSQLWPFLLNITALLITYSIFGYAIISSAMNGNIAGSIFAFALLMLLTTLGRLNTHDEDNYQDRTDTQRNEKSDTHQ